MADIALKWTGDGSRMFVGRDSFGHVLVAGSWPGQDDAWKEWRGVKPSDLLLLSLASCSGHDVVMILERQRQELSGLCVRVSGHNAPEPPYQFTEIHQHFILEGSNLDPRKCERAIELSVEKYCSVAATIRGVATLTYSLEIV